MHCTAARRGAIWRRLERPVPRARSLRRGRLLFYRLVTQVYARAGSLSPRVSSGSGAPAAVECSVDSAVGAAPALAPHHTNSFALVLQSNRYTYAERHRHLTRY
jgi:hypothetical protein